MGLFDKLRNLGKKKKDTVKQTGNNQYGKVPKNTTKKKTTSPVPRNNNPAPVKSTVDKNTNTIIVNGTRYSDMTHTAKTKKQAKFENITHDITKGLSHDQIVSKYNIDLSENWDKVDKKKKKEEKTKPPVNTYLNNPALKSTKETVYNKRKEIEKKEADRKEKERRAQRSQEAKLNLMSDKELEKLAKEYQNLKKVVKNYEKENKKDAKKVVDLEILDADSRNEIQETYKARLAELESIPGLEGYLKRSKQNRQEAKVEAEKHEVKQLTPWEAQTIVNAQRQGGADTAYVKKIMDTLAPEAGKKLAENTAAEWNRRPGLYGFEEGASLIDLQRYLEGITGQKIDADKAKQTAAHLAGEAGGMIAQSMATGAGLLSGEEVAAKLAGKSGSELLKLLGKAAGKTALTNAAVDAPINILQALKEVKESEIEGKKIPDGVDKTYNKMASGGKYLAENIEPGSDKYNVENKTVGNMNDWNQDLYNQAQEIARKNGKTPFFGVDKNGYLHYSFSEGGLAKTLEYYNKAENPTYTLDYQGKSYENRSKGTFAKSLIANEAMSALVGGAMDTAGILKATKGLNKNLASGINPEVKPEVAAPVNKTKVVPKEKDIPDARTGRVTPQNMTPDTFDRIAGKLESRSGAKIKTVDRADINGADGMYQNGTIYIAKDATDPAYTVLKHELTHHIETSENYDAFQDFIIKSQKERGVDVNKELEELRARYKNAGVDLEEGEEVREYVANFAQEYLFNSEESINRLARENPSLFRQIYDWIVDTVSKLTGDSDTKYLIEAQRKYEKALRTVKEGTGDAKSKYLYVTATEAEMDAAEAMEANGATPAEIKKALNLHRGDDGGWRYETDDSRARFYPEGNRNIIDSQPDNIQNYLDYPEAYQREPGLKNISVTSEGLPKEASAAYIPNEHRILYDKTVDNSEGTFLHELQHAAQKEGGYSPGASPRAWEKAIRENNLTEVEDLQDLQRYLDRLKFVYDTADSPKTKERVLKKIQELQEKLDIAYETGILPEKPLDPIDAYNRTAGEAEANDVANRLKYTTEERKEIMPYLLGNKALFAEDTDVANYLYVKPTEAEVKAAEKMEAEGASPEEIKKKLNVHRGDDNKWRYETDDSKAKYYPRGDAKYASDPEYKRYDELRTKQENWYFGKSDEGLTASEQEEYNKLLQKYGQDRSKHLTLSDYWDNKEAYERNPELADIPVNKSNRFGAYERGEYNRALGEITLRTGIDDPLDTLAHEAQHASQNVNSFAGGSSPGYWQNRIEKGESFGSYDKQIKEAEKNMSDMMETLPEEYRTKLEDIWDAEKNGKPDVAQKLWDSVDDDDQYKEIMEEIDWELYALNDYKRNNRYRDANQLYRDTAGEIEARDTAGRLNLSEEERRNTMPKLGKDRAVFSESSIPDKQKSIETYVDKNGKEKKRVRLDTDKFDNLSEDAKRTKHKENVEKKLAGKKLGAKDSTGKELQIAKKSDKVRKIKEDGSLSGKHKVISKLTKYGDDTRAKIVDHIDEVAQVSEKSGERADNTHGWMDKKGWEYRKANVYDPETGENLEVKLNVAKGDRSIVYDVNRISQIKKEAGGPRPDTNGPSKRSSTDFNSSLTDNEGKVKKNEAKQRTEEDVRFDIEQLQQSREYKDQLRDYNQKKKGLGLKARTELRNNYPLVKDHDRLLEELRNLPKEKPKKTELKVEENKNGYGSGHMIADPREYPDEAVNLSDMTMAFSDDIYSSRANRIHGTNDSYSKEAIDIIQKAKDNPNMDITIYRAVPKGLTSDINQGDWVTIVKGYAQTHGEGPLKGDYDILEGKVKAKDLYTEGNSIYEYGVWRGDSKQGTNLGITNKAGIPEAAKKQMKIPEAKSKRDEKLYNKSLKLYGEKTNKYIKKADVKDTASFNGEIPKAKEPVKEIPKADGKATAADKAIPGTKKAEKYERRQVRNFDDSVKEALGIVKYSDNKKIKNLTEDMVSKLKSGSLSDADKDKLFAEMFSEGLAENENYVNTYKEVRDRIRNVRLQINDDIKNNITDYKSWRNENRHFRFADVGEGDSLPIDTFYHSMQELHPDVFPDVRTQSEMLEELGKVANTYDDTYKRIEDMTGNLDEFYEYGRQKFYDAVDELEKEVNIVKRYKDSKTIKTYEEVQTAQKDIKKLKRKYEKLNDEIILTDDERDDLNKFVKGKISEEKINRDYPETSGKILTLAKAKKEYMDASAELKEIGAETRQRYADIADDFLQNSDRWNDKKMGFAYNRETPERNMIDVAGKTDGQRLNEEYFETIHQHEANANKMKQALRDEVKALNIDSNKKIYSLDGISADIKDKDIANDLLKIGKNGKSQKVSESAILQLYGEGIISKEGVRAVGANADKIERAALKMREIYNQLLDVANQEYMKHGYEPIEYRKDYFPHFEDNKPNGPIAKIADSLGIEIQKDDLPTDIAGLTHTFRPGRKWFGNALSRTGTRTEYDAIKGFDIYLEGISDVIHHTEDIQKLRSLENTLRYKYSDKGIRERLDDLDKRLSEGEINTSEYESLREKIYETGNTKLSNMAVWLRDYTDSLAGKKTMSDRTMEHNVGRTFYNATKAIEGRVAANMVAVNPGSWLTNFIPLTQGGNVSTKDVIRGMAETLQNKIKPDMLMDQSTFFVNRKGSDVLWKSNVEKVQDFMTKPMQIIDEFVSESMVRAKYNADIKKGIKDVDALRNADAFAAEVIADRSKGALPNVFNSKNPLTKILTMYQVEVNNQWSHLLKDIPRNADSKAAVALAFTNFAVGAYIFNDVYEELTGRRSAMDPISWVNDFMGDATGYKIPNFVEAIEAGLSKEKEVSFKVDKAADTGTAVGKLGKNIAQDIPYVGGLLEGGRVPISSALPKASVVIPDVVNMASGEMNKKKGLEEVSKELAKPLTYIVPPVGGGQAKKMIQAGKTLKNQGVYGYDKDGNKKLKYAVDRTPSNVVKGMLFGQYAMGNAKDYVDNFQSLDANKTSAYINMVQAGMKPTDAEKYVKSLDDSSKKVLAKSEAYAQLVTAGVDADKAQKILATIPTKRKAETMRKVILNSDLTGKQKNIIGNMLEPDRKIDYTNEATYKYSLMTDDQKKKVDKYKKNAGLSTSKAVKAYEAKKGLSSQKDQALALIEAGYSKKVIQALEPSISDNSYAMSKQMYEAGITVKEYTTARKKANTNHNSYVSMDEAQIYLDKQKNMSRAEKYNLFAALTGCKPSNNRYK